MKSEVDARRQMKEGGFGLWGIGAKDVKDEEAGEVTDSKTEKFSNIISIIMTKISWEACPDWLRWKVGGM